MSNVLKAFQIFSLAILMTTGIMTYASNNKTSSSKIVPHIYADSNPGAIWTTDLTCSGTNVNLFPNKQDVYLNGGPANSSPQVFPMGIILSKLQSQMVLC